MDVRNFGCHASSTNLCSADVNPLRKSRFVRYVLSIGEKTVRDNEITLMAAIQKVGIWAFRTKPKLGPHIFIPYPRFGGRRMKVAKCEKLDMPLSNDETLLRSSKDKQLLVKLFVYIFRRHIVKNVQNEANFTQFTVSSVT